MRILGQLVLGICFVAMVSAKGAGSFVTEGNAIRKMAVGTVKDAPVLFLGELDGSVSCYTTEGRKLWRNAAGEPAVLFKIVAADVDLDGSDDVLTASGDGSVACWAADGGLLWRFRPENKMRMNEVAVLARGDETRIFAGGNDRMVYVLDRKGQMVEKKEFGSAIRSLEIGDFQKDGEPLLFVKTLKHDKFSWLDFALFDPDDLSGAKASLPAAAGRKKGIQAGMMTDLRVQDFDGDGCDDLVLFFPEMKTPVVKVVNGSFDVIFDFEIKDRKALKKEEKQRYAHSIGTLLPAEVGGMLVQFGQLWLVVDSDGRIAHRSGTRFAASDVRVHPRTGELFAAGSVGGDNGVYGFNLKEPEWWIKHKRWTGRMADVVENLEMLYGQVLSFEAPPYQKAPGKPWVMNMRKRLPEKVESLDFNEVVIVGGEALSEDFDRSEIAAAIGAKWAAKRDKRPSYKDKRKDILEIVKGYEDRGEPFISWVGHGSDPFYVSIDTLEAILEAAPTMCYGFTYAEMANDKDPRVHYFIKEYMPRLAKALRKQGKGKLYFRYKQTFWSTVVHTEPWREMFLSGKYADILVPATEDTNSITQDLNHAGRVGMFSKGYVNDYAMRLVDDNPTGWRPVAPGRQRTASAYIRSGVMRAAYGARFGLIFPFSGIEGPDMDLLIALMKSGVLPVVDADKIASIGSWHLMDEPPHHVMEREHIGHDISQYRKEDMGGVFSGTNTHWAGVSLPGHDFSKRALGVDYRWLNFLPKLPNGMVPILPLEKREELEKAGVPYSASNSSEGVAREGRVPGTEYGDKISIAAKAGAKRLPVLVDGAAWSAVWLDERHLRVILIDPNYLDPRDSEVTILFQNGAPVWVRDVLAKETVPVVGGKAVLTVPAGSLRFIDVEL